MTLADFRGEIRQAGAEHGAGFLGYNWCVVPKAVYYGLAIAGAGLVLVISLSLRSPVPATPANHDERRKLIRDIEGIRGRYQYVWDHDLKVEIREVDEIVVSGRALEGKNQVVLATIADLEPLVASLRSPGTAVIAVRQRTPGAMADMPKALRPAYDNVRVILRKHRFRDVLSDED